tara:strand:- start:4166 stop:5236 length:1071 start_codon:yes stop_codon:yes gene_type:complete
VAKDFIHKDIKFAKTLHSDYYIDSEKFSRIKKIFHKKWHFAIHASEFEDSNLIPLGRMGSLMNEEIVLSKTSDINPLSNVCTHRGMLLVNKKCTLPRINCPYHGRKFNLEGKFQSMPKFETVENFPTVEDNLKKFHLQEWKNILFLSKNDHENFHDFIEFLEKRIGWMDIENFSFEPSKDRSHVINANWALYVDNYLEGFHIPFVHGDLNKIIENESYKTELFSNGVLQIGYSKSKDLCFELPEESPDFGSNVAAYYFWVFPNTMFNFYPWGLSVNIVVPLNIEKTEVIYRGYVKNPHLTSEGAGGDLDKVEIEDQEVVEAVQLGLSSDSYSQGRYSPEKETGVHHFHRLLIESLK